MQILFRFKAMRSIYNDKEFWFMKTIDMPFVPRIGDHVQIIAKINLKVTDVLWVVRIKPKFIEVTLEDYLYSEQDARDIRELECNGWGRVGI